MFCVQTIKCCFCLLQWNKCVTFIWKLGARIPAEPGTKFFSLSKTANPATSVLPYTWTMALTPVFFKISFVFGALNTVPPVRKVMFEKSSSKLRISSLDNFDKSVRWFGWTKTDFTCSRHRYKSIHYFLTIPFEGNKCMVGWNGMQIESKTCETTPDQTIPFSW